MLLNTEPQTPKVYGPQVSVAKAFFGLLAAAGHIPP